MATQSKQSNKKKKGAGKIYMFQAINKLFKEHIMFPEQRVAET